MAFHDNARLDAAFSTTHGAAVVCSVTPVGGGDAYTAAVIVEKDVEALDADSGMYERQTLLEFRKSELSDSAAGLLRGTTVLIGARTYKIQILETETTYTLKYVVT